MSKDGTDWDLLNAYADDELAGPERDRMEARLADDPALAGQLDDIRSLQRSLAGLRPAASPVADKKTPAPRRMAVWGAAVAACLVVAVLVAGLWPRGDRWIDVVIERHETLSQVSYIIDQTPDHPVISAGLGDTMQAPDLTASKLFLVQVATDATPLGDVIAMHYRGLNGCRLSVIAATGADAVSSAGPETAMSGHLFTDLLLGHYRVAVIADGMDEGRFDAIAAAVEATLMRQIEEAEAYRIAMSDSYARALPCA